MAMDAELISLVNKLQDTFSNLGECTTFLCFQSLIYLL